MFQGRLALARHANFASRATPEGLKRMSQFAVDRFAYPYGEEEIARITARIVGSFLGFDKGEIERDQEYICSEYVYECYRMLGIEVSYDEKGFVAPADFARDARVELMWELETGVGVKRRSYVHQLPKGSSGGGIFPDRIINCNCVKPTCFNI